MVKSVNDTNVWVAGIHWQTGLEGHVDYIVSEDKDLHRLGQYQTIRVLNKQAFLRVLEAD